MVLCLKWLKFQDYTSNLRKFYMKVTVIITPTNLVINSFLALCFPSLKENKN